MEKSLLLQIGLILGMSRLLSALLRLVGQPAVVAEIATGIILGPIVLGRVIPHLHAELFGTHALSGLEALSDLGVVLFMFTAGAELRVPSRGDVPFRSTLFIGGMCFLLPFALGALLGEKLYANFGPPDVPRFIFSIFVGVALSVSALPVMVRILQDRAELRTAFGSISLASATLADLISWGVLLLLIALRDGFSNSAYSLKWMLGVCVVIGMLKVLKPALARAVVAYSAESSAIISLALVGCAYVTQVVGIHEAYGAFLVGICVPRNNPAIDAFVTHLNQVSVLIFMPVFFAFAGLTTTEAVLTDSAITALMVIMAAAISGKVIGGALGARLAGHSWQTAFRFGSIMNARGLMELIVIRVGLDRGIIEREMFTILLSMAVVTTMVASPMLKLLDSRNESAHAAP